MNILKRALVFMCLFLVTKVQGETLQIVSIERLRTYLTYIKIHDPIRLKFTSFPLASSYSSTWASPVLPKTFIVKIPNGRVYSQNGYAIIAKKYLARELLWQWSPLKKKKKILKQHTLPVVRHVKGTVVVLTQEGHDNYYHWITEILPKLELLKNIDYDWIYLPRLNHAFQHETLSLLGVDRRKIIEADDDTFIEAEQLIVPSYVSKSCYTPRWVVDYLKQKFIHSDPAVQSMGEKIFISRQKAAYRRVINEDQIFSLFEPLGFKRYNLEDLKFSEQIQLFRNAKVIVAFHGAGLTNLVFSQPGARIVEIFQEHEDDSYCYLSQTLGLRYDCIKTTKFKKDGGYTSTTVPLDIIQDFIDRKFKVGFFT
ncbi:glycosyltransferase family 61 protein [Candidatus Finniella inopinata]|uniref:Glycosyltransferase family 61 protein n=1 Tax=Candidatus Finniella inopinata TaxID=1696036 RepID=A0A4Q7DJB2_9PROT|nr:glycosyltransferase family 61 protein [Candidatus Finniella inopinata]RZI46943.1 glycosyltransferase family 61 protein [Candidatus Finniella inopinata]